MNKSQSLSSWQVILLLVWVFFMLLWPPIITIVTLAFPAQTGFPVDWRIKAVFWFFVNVWWYYVLHRGWIRREAMKKMSEHEKLKEKLDEFRDGEADT